MTAAGQLAVDAANTACRKGGYVLLVEGGVPTAFGGATCWLWTHDGRDVTMLEAVHKLAWRAGGPRFARPARRRPERH